MQLPVKVPGLKLVTILMAVYAVLWISWEGALWRVVVMGAGITAVSLLHLLQNYGRGRVLTLRQWLGLMAGLGLLFGVGSGLLTLMFMAVKTGLHAHGPEFSLQEIQWVSRQIPVWAMAGLLIGLGLGMLSTKQS
jgi:hypothetical protein